MSRDSIGTSQAALLAVRQGTLTFLGPVDGACYVGRWSFGRRQTLGLLVVAFFVILKKALDAFLGLDCMIE
jgi:hypothetical protein